LRIYITIYGHELQLVSDTAQYLQGGSGRQSLTLSTCQCFSDDEHVIQLQGGNNGDDLQVATVPLSDSRDSVQQHHNQHAAKPGDN